MAIPNALVTNAAVGELSMDQPNDAPREDVQHRGAIDLALASWVLGDVRDPELVPLRSVELSVDEVACGRRVRRATVAGPSRYSLKSGTTHQQLNGVTSHSEAPPQGGFGVHPTRAVYTSEVSMDLLDDSRQLNVAQRSRRWCSCAPVVIARF